MDTETDIANKVMDTEYSLVFNSLCLLEGVLFVGPASIPGFKTTGQLPQPYYGNGISGETRPSLIVKGLRGGSGENMSVKSRHTMQNHSVDESSET